MRKYGRLRGPLLPERQFCFARKRLTAKPPSSLRPSVADRPGLQQEQTLNRLWRNARGSWIEGIPVNRKEERKHDGYRSKQHSGLDERGHRQAERRRHSAGEGRCVSRTARGFVEWRCTENRRRR